jgi:amino acid adenylation domain-containing protein
MNDVARGARWRLVHITGTRSAPAPQHAESTPSLDGAPATLSKPPRLAVSVDHPLPRRFLASLLWQAADRRPLHPALVGREGQTSYEALRRRASSITVALRAGGVGADDRVAIFMERGPEAVSAYFGALAAGAIVIVVNERFRPRQVEHVLRDATASVLLTERTLLDRQPRAIESAANVVDTSTIPTSDVAADPLPRLATDFAQIIYSSGSTGAPKGVTFTHGALLAGVEAVAGYLGLHADDRIVSLLPFSSVYGLNQLLCAVVTGATLLVEQSPVPKQVVTNLAELEATVLAAVPPLWMQLLGVPSFRTTPLPTLRLVQNAGGHLPVSAVRQLRSAQPQASLFLQYGMTETFRSTFLPPEHVDARPDSMGRAVPGSEILVVREDGTPCDVGEIGELVHRGPSVAAGYWNAPEITAQTFRENPARPSGAPSSERVVFSGDMVRRDAEGFLYYVSRRDRMIKTLGYRVGPDEIADVLHASGQITEAVVTTEPDEQRGERIVAFVVLAEAGALDRLEHHCRVELPRYMQPGRFEVVAAIPRIASGKYDLAALKAMAPVKAPSMPLPPLAADPVRSG